jgi:hypothetical protein
VPPLPVPPLVVVLVLVRSPLEQVQMQVPSWSLVLPQQVSVVYLGKPRPLV